MIEKIKASMIFEMIGRPKEHLEATIKQLLETIDKEKGVALTSKKVHESKIIENKDKEGKLIPVEEGKEMFSTFAEVDMEVEHLLDVVRVCFKYLPSHVEIIKPEELFLNNYDVSSILSEIVTKMHNYDALAKSAIINNQMLAKRLQELQKNDKEQSTPNMTFTTDKAEKNIKKKKKF